MDRALGADDLEAVRLVKRTRTPLSVSFLVTAYLPYSVTRSMYGRRSGTE